LPLEGGAEDDDDGDASQGALLALLQRLRFGGDTALGFDLCELALAGLASPQQSGEALAAPTPAAAAVSAAPARPQQPQQPQQDRAAARRRARFVRSLVMSTLRDTQPADGGGGGGGGGSAP
jgi:hypothetical protein